MLHDAPRLNEARFVRAAEAIWDRFKDEFYGLAMHSERIVVAIAGGPVTGKTSIACILCRLINEDARSAPSMVAKHLSADDLYVANYFGHLPGLRDTRRKEAQFKDLGPCEYNWSQRVSPYDSISKVISTFKGRERRRICTIPCVDALSQQIDRLVIDLDQEVGEPITASDGLVMKIGRINILIVEGLYAIDRRMRADYNFFVLGSYFQDKPWGVLRPPEFEDELFGSFTVQEDRITRIRQYATNVTQHMGTTDKQDIRGRGRLTEDRIVILEMEHQAVQQMKRDIIRQISEGRAMHFATILPLSDGVIIE